MDTSLIQQFQMSSSGADHLATVDVCSSYNEQFQMFSPGANHLATVDVCRSSYNEQFQMSSPGADHLATVDVCRKDSYNEQTWQVNSDLMMRDMLLRAVRELRNDLTLPPELASSDLTLPPELVSSDLSYLDTSVRDEVVRALRSISLTLTAPPYSGLSSITHLVLDLLPKLLRALWSSGRRAQEIQRMKDLLSKDDDDDDDDDDDEEGYHADDEEDGEPPEPRRPNVTVKVLRRVVLLFLDKLGPVSEDLAPESLSSLADRICALVRAAVTRSHKSGAFRRELGKLTDPVAQRAAAETLCVEYRQRFTSSNRSLGIEAFSGDEDRCLTVAAMVARKVLLGRVRTQLSRSPACSDPSLTGASWTGTESEGEEEEEEEEEEEAAAPLSPESGVVVMTTVPAAAPTPDSGEVDPVRSDIQSEDVVLMKPRRSRAGRWFLRVLRTLSCGCCGCHGNMEDVEDRSSPADHE